MPTVSREQQKAMFAAASGHSTLGIPQSVGKKFAAADIARAHGRSTAGYERGGPVLPDRAHLPPVDMARAHAVKDAGIKPAYPSRPPFMR
jgi:hypothetical protein